MGVAVAEPGSWEADMMVKCKTSFTAGASHAILYVYSQMRHFSPLFGAHLSDRIWAAPVRAQAILFYSQFSGGELDPASLHGGCPVEKGTKWAANLWVWNAPRWVPPAEENPTGSVGGAAGADRNTPLTVSFENSGAVKVELLWGAKHWGSE